MSEVTCSSSQLKLKCQSVLQKQPETTAKLCVFFPRASGFWIRTRRSQWSVLGSASTRWIGNMDPGRGKCESNSGMIWSGSGLRHGPFGTSGGSTILIGAAGAPMGNWPLCSEVCSLLVLVNSEAVTVVPSVSRGGLAVIQWNRRLNQWCWFDCRLVGR